MVLLKMHSHVIKKFTYLCYVLLVPLSVSDGAICISSENCPDNETSCVQNCTAVALENNLPALFGNCGVLWNETGGDVYYCHTDLCITDFPNICNSSVPSCCCTEDHCNIRHEDSLTPVHREFYLGHVPNYVGLVITIMTSGLGLENYSIEAPLTGYYYNGNVTENFQSVIQLLTGPISSFYQDFSQQNYLSNEGIYISSDSQELILVGQNERKDYYFGDTYFALPIKHLHIEEYVYYAMSSKHNFRMFNGSVLLVIGTENETVLNITVPVPAVITNESNAVLHLLIPGLTYCYKINRLQIIYLFTDLYDLTGAKIVANKPVSVLSGHECGFVPARRYYCHNLVEQMLPTELWGTVHYVAPLASRSNYTIKLLATHDTTNIQVICTNTQHTYILNTANFITYILNSQEFCVIFSTSIISVVQFSHGYNEDEQGAPMMTLIPSTTHFTNTITSSTFRNPNSLGGRVHRNYVNIIVMADYYQPNMIFLSAGGVNQSLESQSWVPIRRDNSIEAYATQVRLNITEGVFKISHINQTALMTAIVYGFDSRRGYLSSAYGHPGWLNSYLVKVRFTQTSYTINEDDGAVHPVLVLDNPSLNDITVQVNIITGSAAGGIDYDSGPYSVTFTTGMTTYSLDIVIFDDHILEQNETFFLSINSVILPDRVTGITPDQTTITIQDDDAVVVNFNQSVYSVDEDNGLAQPVLVVTSGSSAFSFTVLVATTNGSATGGDVDYDPGPYSITFPAGVASVSFVILINDDKVLEENETFYLHINALPNGVSTGHLNQTIITILDDDAIPSRAPSGSKPDEGTSQVIITTIAAVIAVIMLVVFFGFCAYKLKRKMTVYRREQNQDSKPCNTPMHMSPAHSITYSTIGRDRPSTCESVGSKDNAYEEVLSVIDEESSSVFSGSITNEDMLDFISGHDKSSQFINSSGLGTEMETSHSRITLPNSEGHYITENDMGATNTGQVFSDSHPTNASSEGDRDSISSYCTGGQFIAEVIHPDYYDEDASSV